MTPLPSEAIFDKITMLAFEGTLLDIALRDCGITTFVIVGVAMEIGIEPTVRHGADLEYIPVVVTDACWALGGDRAISGEPPLRGRRVVYHDRGALRRAARTSVALVRCYQQADEATMLAGV